MIKFAERNVFSFSRRDYRNCVACNASIEGRVDLNKDKRKLQAIQENINLKPSRHTSWMLAVSDSAKVFSLSDCLSFTAEFNLGLRQYRRKISYRFGRLSLRRHEERARSCSLLN